MFAFHSCFEYGIAFKKQQSMQSNLDLLMAEYKLGEEIGGKYFSYMYSCINYTFLFYGAAILVFYNIFINQAAENSSIVYFTVFHYLLPITTYTFGLFYAYNAVVISRQGYYMIQIENDMIKLCKEMDFNYKLHGWDRTSKELPSGFILPYGTMLIFYIVFPLAFLYFGSIFGNYEFLSNSLLKLIFVKVIPFGCAIVYLVFMVYLIRCMFKMKKLYREQIAIS